MIKINIFSMVFSKTDCLFHFQTEIKKKIIYFSYGQYCALEKVHFACDFFLGLFFF